MKLLKIITIAPLLALQIVSCSKEMSQPNVSVTGVTLSSESIEIEIGEQKILTATVSPSDATNKNVSFISSKASVAAVSQDGIVEGISSGKVIVTVTTEDGKHKAHCNVTVVDRIVHVTGISLNITSLSMKEGDEFALIPKISPDNATDKTVNWSSDNEAIVMVSSEGIVKALKAGKATVTATTVDEGKTASCSIDVTEGLGVVTGAATHISCRSAEIVGKANLPSTTSTDLTFGILYSTSSGVLLGSATKIEAHSFDSEYNYSINTEVLEPETTYYYRAYISQNGEITYGEVKSFKTLAVSSLIRTLDVTDINPKDAVLNAILDLTDCKYDGIEYGFKVTPEGGIAYTIKSGNHSENKFSAKDESLSRDTKYSVEAYVTLDGRKYEGEAKKFTTTSVQVSVTAESSNVKCNIATISGKLTVESEGTFTKSATLYYSSTASTFDALKSSGTRKTLTLDSDGSFSADLSSLVSDTQYNYVVVAKVDEIEFDTDINSFRTLQITASVTAESSNVDCFSATISGKLTIESEGTFAKSATLYYSSTASTFDALKSSGTRKTLTLDSDGSFSADLSSLVSNTQYNYVVVAKVYDLELQTDVCFFKTQSPPSGLVDLGLSVFWATCNLGASKPEECGGFYQWAGTRDVSSTSIYLDWSDCPYHTGSSSSTGWTKYIPSGKSSYWSGPGSPDNKTILGPDDDAAHINLDDKWRMPTEAEWTELISNCTWTWTTVNGVKGYKVTSKKSGYKGNCIFLPAAGLRRDGDLNNAGQSGYYWSSSLNTLEPYYARCLDFNSDDVGTYGGSRCYGRSVRPVSK